MDVNSAVPELPSPEVFVCLGILISLSSSLVFVTSQRPGRNQFKEDPGLREGHSSAGRGGSWLPTFALPRERTPGAQSVMAYEERARRSAGVPRVKSVTENFSATSVLASKSQSAVTPPTT